MQPTLISSFHPHRHPARQLRCLGGWRAAGCDLRVMVTHAPPPEMGDYGLMPGDMRKVGPQDAGYDAAGVPSPRVMPILKRLARESATQPFVFARSGLYPALRGPDAVDHWLREAPALALTAEGATLFEGHRFSDHAPLHDQIDAIVLTPAIAARMLPILDAIPIAQTMCLGDPGWSLLLAAVLSTPKIGGVIAESGVLLREDGVVRSIDAGAFAPYIAPLSTLGLTNAVIPQEALADCATHIAQACAQTQTLRETTRALYLAVPEPETALTDQARQIARDLLRLVPWAEWNYDITMLSRLIHRLQSDHALSYTQVAAYLRSGPSIGHQFAEGLFALNCMIRALTAPPGLNSAYPAGSDHAARVHQIRAEADNDPMRERLAVLALFGHEVTCDHVFNPRLYDYLALACHNDDERLLLTHLHTAFGKVPHAA